MKLSLSEMERIDLIFFPFSRFLLWQNDMLFIQPLKQKNDWRSNEGQIVFQPADTVSNQLNTSHKMAAPKVYLWRPLRATFPETTLPSLPLSPKYTLKENFPVGGFTSSQGPALSFVCSSNNLWLSFYFVGAFLILHHCWLWLYFSSMSLRPRELVFLFPWMNKCFS